MARTSVKYNPRSHFVLNLFFAFIPVSINNNMNRPDDDANEEPPNGEEEHKDYTSSDEDKDETEEGEDYHPYTPFVREVKYAGGKQFPYQPMTQLAPYYVPLH